MSPVDECFLSCSLDNTMRLWDLRSPTCQGIMTNELPALAAFDRDGMVFGVALGSKSVKLFDIRNFEQVIRHFKTMYNVYRVHSNQSISHPNAMLNLAIFNFRQIII
jgi:WD40 repeat protein